MKRFLFIALIMILASVAFADGSVKDIKGNTVSIETLQNGFVVLKTDENRLVISNDVCQSILGFLKKNKECIDTFATEQIIIKDYRSMGSIEASIGNKIRFSLYLNTDNHPQYSLVLLIDSVEREYLEFDQASLSQFIQELENTKDLVTKYNDQRKRVNEIIGNNSSNN